MLCVLTGCVREPEWYSIPQQRAFSPEAEPLVYMSFVRMNETKAPSFIVRDITLGQAEGVGWRWTHQRPELKFTLKQITDQRLIMDFGVVPATFKQTGPVTITFLVNGHQLDRIRYAEPGDKHFEKPVPAEWLKANDPATVIAEIDPVYTSTPDGVKLGVTLSAVGFLGPAEKAN